MLTLVLHTVNDVVQGERVPGPRKQCLHSGTNRVPRLRLGGNVLAEVRFIAALPLAEEFVMTSPAVSEFVAVILARRRAVGNALFPFGMPAGIAL